MNQIIGQCGLCKKQKALMESHLIPKSVYKIVVTKSSSNNPVLVKGGKSKKTSKQVKSHFLCSCCEKRLSKYGEDHVLKYTYRDTGRFIFQNILEGIVHEREMDGALVFVGSKIPKIKINHFIHFALGVFWKASAGKWKFLGQQLVNNQLGKRYETQFREFLLGTSQFPENAILTVSISNKKEPFPIAIFPIRYKHDGYFQHRFYIPGIEFILWVGNLIPNKNKDISISQPSGGAFFFEDLDKSPLLIKAKQYLKGKTNNFKMTSKSL